MAQFSLNVYESGLTKVFPIIQQFSTVKWEQRQGSYKNSLLNPEKRATNADLMLVYRLRRWANINAVLDECLVPAGRWLMTEPQTFALITKTCASNHANLFSYLISIFTHLKLCLATAIHNFKWVKITHIFLIWDQRFANLDV